MKIINESATYVTGGCERCCQPIPNKIPFYQTMGAASLMDLFQKIQCDWFPFHIDIQFS